MKNAFIIHGAYGTPQENWFPWLAKKLEELGYTVTVPQFPTPEGQNLDAWIKVFEQYKKKLNSETIFIGHSIAVAFILRLLEQVEKPIHASFLVACFIEELNNDEVDYINATFYDKAFNWEKIKRNCQNFVCFNSDNDPYVPLWKGQEVADALEVDITLVKGAGHFNGKAGYIKFPLLLEKIKSI